MKNENRLKVLVVAPACDGTDVGEAWCAFKWIESLAAHCDVTLLTQHRPWRLAPSLQFFNVEVVEWPTFALPARLQRLQSMLKPDYPVFYRRAEAWIAEALQSGRTFDIAHQFTPIALRYPSPLAGSGIPYLIGPLGGSLETPAGFTKECRGAPWYTKLRRLDRLRLRYDRRLRQSYAGAAAVLGVAPYVGELLDCVPLQRFEIMSEIGVDGFIHRPADHGDVREGLKLLHVGRVIRTKGLRDVIRALGQLQDLPNITLDSAGVGEDMEACISEVRRLGLQDRVRFHGWLDKPGVRSLYRDADVFTFPSFREPSGTVVFEALSHGLPVLTVDHGGPGFVVDDTCGASLPVENPEQLAAALAEEIRRLYNDRKRLERLAAGAHTRIEKIGLWPNKVARLNDLYREILDRPQSRTRERAA
jgi:glycosyltransferase involved in cell wall biosynthesis